MKLYKVTWYTKENGFVNDHSWQCAAETAKAARQRFDEKTAFLDRTAAKIGKKNAHRFGVTVRLVDQA